jgi:hypothetical protein
LPLGVEAQATLKRLIGSIRRECLDHIVVFGEARLRRSENVGLSVYSAGIYWTHFWPKGGYLDAVVMESWMTDTTQSTLNVSTCPCSEFHLVAGSVCR